LADTVTAVTADAISTATDVLTAFTAAVTAVSSAAVSTGISAIGGGGCGGVGDGGGDGDGCEGGGGAGGIVVGTGTGIGTGAAAESMEGNHPAATHPVGQLGIMFFHGLDWSVPIFACMAMVLLRAVLSNGQLEVCIQKYRDTPSTGACANNTLHK